MNKKIRKTIATTCALAMSMSIVATLPSCKKDSKTLIGVGLYEDSGAAVTAIRSYLSSLSDELDVNFKYVTLSQTDEATNKTAAQNLISSGCKGLIMTMDLGMASILTEAKKAGVYVAGYLSDFDTTWTEDIKSANFLGTTVDGRYEGTQWGREIAERVIEEGYRNIGTISFPLMYFPHQAEMDAGFRAAVNEYNNAHPEDIITVQEETTQLFFSNLDSTYLTANPNLDAIFAMCAGVQFVYPTLVENNKTNIKLYTAGLVTAEDTLANFGTQGNKCIQEFVYCGAESITYPLVMLLNQIRGEQFSDYTTAQRIEPVQIRVTNNEDLNFLKTHNLQFTGKASDAVFTPEQVKGFLAVNGGTHAKLVEAMNHIGLDDLKAKVNG